MKYDDAAKIVRDAGGRIVGRTKLQKTSYLLEAAGVGYGFNFGYKHYGPYSEELALATSEAVLHNILSEEIKPTAWGGGVFYFSSRCSRCRRC